MPDLTPALASEYARLWDTMNIVPTRVGTVDATARRLLRDLPRYMAVSHATGVPAVVIMVIHERECGGRFDRHLHNGDPLTARTVQVPAGRPKAGKPPFTWEASAIDALRYQSLDKIANWTIPQACHSLELYNGLGYRRRGLRSPYLWGATNHQQAGKYVADGRFDPGAVDRQLGACAVMYRLMSLEPSLAFGRGSLPPDVEPARPSGPTPVSAGRPPPDVEPVGDPVTGGPKVSKPAQATGFLAVLGALVLAALQSDWRWWLGGALLLAAIGVVMLMRKNKGRDDE